jgi:uncharacterized protein (DUF433 family)
LETGTEDAEIDALREAESTRIPIWALEQAKHLGVTEADLLRSYPTLRAEDLVHAWAYARAHREEI